MKFATLGPEQVWAQDQQLKLGEPPQRARGRWDTGRAGLRSDDAENEPTT